MNLIVTKTEINVPARKLRKGYKYSEDEDGNITISRQTTDAEKIEFCFNNAMKVLDE